MEYPVLQRIAASLCADPDFEVLMNEEIAGAMHVLAMENINREIREKLLVFIRFHEKMRDTGTLLSEKEANDNLDIVELFRVTYIGDKTVLALIRGNEYSQENPVLVGMESPAERAEFSDRLHQVLTGCTNEES